MALTTATTNVLGNIRVAQRMSITALKQAIFTGWRALCGDAFFDALIGHAKVEDKYLNSADNRLLARGRPRLRCHRLRRRGLGKLPRRQRVKQRRHRPGRISRPTMPISFRRDRPSLFVTNFAPADYVETVNTIGLPRYAKQEPMKMGKGIDIETQTNPLCLCTRPRAVVKLTRV